MKTFLKTRFPFLSALYRFRGDLLGALESYKFGRWHVRGMWRTPRHSLIIKYNDNDKANTCSNLCDEHYERLPLILLLRSSVTSSNNVHTPDVRWRSPASRIVIDPHKIITKRFMSLGRLRFLHYSLTICFVKIWDFHCGDYEECSLLGYKNPLRTSQETHYLSATETSRLLLCKTWDFHCDDYEERRLLGYVAVWLL
jgi:hypothetical protein